MWIKNLFGQSLKACTKAVILSYVPVENPSRAIDKIILFLIITNDPGPSEVPYADTNCITGGNTNARANGNGNLFFLLNNSNN